MRTWIVVVVAALALGGCGRSSSAGLLIQAGDLPAALSAGPTQPAPPRQLYMGPLAGDETIFQSFLRDGEKSGSVTFLRFTDQAARDQAYRRVLDSLGDGTTALPDIGEQSAAVLPEVGFDGTEIAFIRCQAVVHVRMFRVPMESTVTYAKRLDERLAQAICS